MCLLLEITHAPDARLEGQLRTCAGDTWKSFSGVLELLKVLEESLDANEEQHSSVQADEGTAPWATR